jgi:outer membrane protein assembly factor BamB
MRRRKLLRGLGAGIAVTAFSTGVSTAQTGGTEKWRFATDGPVSSSPAVSDGTVYVGNYDNRLYAVDAASGHEEWRFETAGNVGGSDVAGGTVYVDGAEGLYAVDAGDGSEEWRFEPEGSVRSSPAVAGGMVYVQADEGTPEGQLHAIDSTDGSEQWRFDIGVVTGDPPVVADGTVYVGGNALYAVGASSGEERWRFRTENEPPVFGGPLAVADGTVYVGGAEGLYAVDAASGEAEWRFETGNAIDAAPTVADGTVYVGSYDNRLYAVDAASGREEWRFETGDRIESSPTAADGTVYVGSYDTNLYAVDSASGEAEWRFGTGRGIGSSPAVADGTVYVGSLDDNLYAVDAGDTGSGGGAGETPSGQTPSDATLSPQSVAFGRTVAGTTETVTLTVSAPAAEPVRVETLEPPANVSVARDCAFALGFLRYDCAPTPPFDVPAGGSKEVTLRLRAPLRGIVTSIDAAATLRTPTGTSSVPVTATSLAETAIVRDFERTAREFATFLGTTSEANAAAVGDEIAGMYADIIQLVGNRAGGQYRDALEEADEAGEKLQQAGGDLDTRQFIRDWEASSNSPDASPQPGELRDAFQAIAGTLRDCRADIEADDLEAAADHARDVEEAVPTVADDVRAAYREMRNGRAGADAEKHLADFVAAVEAYATVVAGPESTSS